MEATKTDINFDLISGTYVNMMDEMISSVEIANSTISGGKFEKNIFVNVVFINCELQGTTFLKTKFIDCEFINCNFSFSKLENCNLVGVRLKIAHFALRIPLTAIFKRAPSAIQNGLLVPAKTIK